MTDVVQLDAEGRAEREHGANNALVVLGHRREPGAQRRELPRQPHTLPQTLAKRVGWTLWHGASGSHCDAHPVADGHRLRPRTTWVPGRNCKSCTLADPRLPKAGVLPTDGNGEAPAVDEPLAWGALPAATSRSTTGSRTCTAPRSRPTRPARANRRSCLLVVWRLKFANAAMSCWLTSKRPLAAGSGPLPSRSSSNSRASGTRRNGSRTVSMARWSSADAYWCASRDATADASGACAAKCRLNTSAGSSSVVVGSSATACRGSGGGARSILAGRDAGQLGVLAGDELQRGGF